MKNLNGKRKTTVLFRFLMALSAITATLVSVAAFASCGFAPTGSGTAKQKAVDASAYRKDFYAAVNRDWLAKNREPPADYALLGTFQELAIENNDRISELLDGLAADKHPRGTKEQKLADFYRSACDIKNRDAGGVSPVKKYLSLYENATTIRELLDADIALFKGTGTSCLLVFGFNLDDRGNPSFTHSGPTPLNLDIYRTKAGKKAYTTYLSTLFALAGYAKKDSIDRAEKVYAFEKELADCALSADKLGNPDNTIRYPFYLFRTLYPGIDVKALFARMGFPPPESFGVSDQRVMEKAASYFMDKNAKTLALYAEARILTTGSVMLSTDFARANIQFCKTIYGIKSDMGKPDYWKKIAGVLAQQQFPEYIGEQYAKKYISPESKRDVEKLVTLIIAEYKTELKQADWMDEWTRERAIIKLDALVPKVGYPETWRDWNESANIRDYAEGGTFFDNCCEANRSRVAAVRAVIGKPQDRMQWNTPVFIANAFYNSYANEIVIPAGILQEPFYSPTYDSSQKIGGIGMTIAHEISHAFDNNGAKRDEHGNVKNWWSKDDLARFTKRCDRISAYYDGFTVAPGIKSNGKLTVSENVSDLAGMRCALDVLSKTDKPDYREFFVSYATLFRQTMTPKYLKWVCSHDVHSVGIVRVNRAVANFGEFQKAFGVVPGDAMYVRPEDRVGIWAQ